ncbi:MAG: 30S ribosomal protein S2 [Candidatus Levybacteria bacterium]|nr:30S ribosomal protein S2 [Candidatus Levybacteria bacterium]
MREITLEELLEAGCHFGHQVTRQNPKARDFVFEARDNIHIIDLAKTKEGLEKAAGFVKELASRGGSIIVVGTKRQAKAIVDESVRKAVENGAEEGLSYVTNRWIGGTLTNFAEVAKNYKKLKDIEERLKNEEERSKYTKREVGLWEKEKNNLENFYGGLSSMKKTPDALFIVDTHNEDLAVREARRMGVTTVGITDTNSDPYLIDYPIPANDDAVGSIKLIVSYIIDAWIEGRKSASIPVPEAKAEEVKVKVEEEKGEPKAAKTKKVFKDKTKKQTK